MRESRRFTFRSIIAPLLIFAIPMALVSSSAAVERDRLAAASDRGVLGFDLAAGRDGYAVMTWSTRASRPGSKLFRANVFVRTRKPGATNFGRRHYLGKASSSSTQVAIGGRGVTTLVWTGLDGYLRIVSRSPRSGWGKSRLVRGARVSGARLSVGPDGTVALASLRNENLGDGRGRVLAVSFAPAARQPARWRVISSATERIGFNVDVVAGTNGESTIVWSGPCRAGPAKVATSWVDLSGQLVSRPRRISGSGCVAWNIDLQADRFGNQYLRLGLLGGVQLAVRKSGRSFEEAVRVNPPGINGGEGFLSVSDNGFATLVWGTSVGKNGFGYVTSRRAMTPSESRHLEGPRTDLSGDRDALLDVAPLPGGNVAMLWAEIGARDSGGGWRKLGVQRWKPGSGLGKLAYSVEIPESFIPFPVGIETGGRASIAWWQLVHERKPIGKSVRWLDR